MTKTDFVRAAAEKADVTQKVAARVIDAFINVVREAAGKGENVRIPGFGAFIVKERAERQGRDIRTGEAITIPAKKVVAFKVGKELKESVM